MRRRRSVVRFSTRRFVTCAVLLLLVTVLFSIAVVDDAGRIVNIPAPPRRVVSASPSATRYLLALGLESRVVGVTAWDVYKKAENIGNMVPLNIEKIYSLRPDLVITFGGFQFPEVAKLEKAGLTAYVLNPTTLNDIIKAVGQLGAVFNVRTKSDQLTRALRDKMTDVGVKASKIPLEKRPKVFFTATIPDRDTKELWTAGTGSFVNELIVIAGGRNIASPYTGNNGWFPVSWEWIVQEDPDAIVVAAHGNREDALRAIRENTIMRNLRAVRNNRLLVLDGDELLQPAPQLFDYLQVLFEFFHGGK